MVEVSEGITSVIQDQAGSVNKEGRNNENGQGGQKEWNLSSIDSQ